MHPRVMVRFEGLPGEFAQFDFGTVRVHYLSGESESLHFAAYRLKYSRWVHVAVVPNEQIEPIVWNPTMAQLAVDFGFGTELYEHREDMLAQLAE